MLRGPRRGGRAAPVPDRRHPRRRVLVDRRGHPLHERARHERALAGRITAVPIVSMTVVPRPHGVRRARGRQEPKPLLSRLARRHVHRGAGAARVRRADRAGRRAHRPARRRHGRGARAVHALQRVRRVASRRRPRRRPSASRTSSACAAKARRSAARPRTRRPRPAFQPSSPRPAAAGSSRRPRSGSTSTASQRALAHLGMLPGNARSRAPGAAARRSLPLASVGGRGLVGAGRGRRGRGRGGSAPGLS